MVRKVLQLLTCDEARLNESRQQIDGLYRPVSAIHLVLRDIELPCKGGKLRCRDRRKVWIERVVDLNLAGTAGDSLDETDPRMSVVPMLVREESRERLKFSDRRRPCI